MTFTKLLRKIFLLLIFYSAVTVRAQDASFFMSQIGSNNLLTTPWDLLYGPDEYLWVTEKEPGIIVRVNPETAERDELIEIDDVAPTIGQDGLLGMALHPGFTGENPYVFVSYTHLVEGERKQKLVRFTYAINGEDGTLSSPEILIDNLPASNDHNSGRLIFGPDGKLYYTIGDQGGNQNRNYCNPIVSQILPTQLEIDAQDWTHYPGKILRLNPDGSIPDDNPILDGVQSHIYSYGHRNPQGIVFSNSGTLYADEHGPNTDDEVNMISAGNNYGWPNVVGYRDDQAYDYCNWSTLSNCSNVSYSNGSCPASATLQEESSFMAENYQEPLFSMFAVTDDYDYDNPACGNSWICRPNVAPSSIGIYESDAIPSWKNSLLVTSLKRGRVYRLQLDESGTAVVGDTMQLFYTQNRYRDIAIHPDGKSFYLITDQSGRTSDLAGLDATSSLRNPGAILKFTLEESVALTDRENQSFFRIWPNPTSKNIYIDLQTSHAKDVRGTLINTSGQVVKRFTGLTPGVNIRELDNFPPGVYMLKLASQNRSWQERVVLHSS
ncbi:MAG: T9SS type A sorting domain-containing protein [Saprospiraceae bacterium]|nr:T9SS type A sorting domain-containing protein [Saprospiraceae bacterium]